MKTNSKQGLEPLLCNEPKILILGSLPGDISIESQEYYANNKNFFWRIIATITGSPVPLSYPAKKAAKSYAQYLKKHSDTTNILGHLHSCACPSTSPAIRCTGLTFNDLVNRWKDILI